jgi:hypothetical protein
MSRRYVESVFDKPWQSVNVGAIAYVYLLQRDEIRKLGTYAVVTYTADERADSVQISGSPWSGNWQVSHLAPRRAL